MPLFYPTNHAPANTLEFFCLGIQDAIDLKDGEFMGGFPYCETTIKNHWKCNKFKGHGGPHLTAIANKVLARWYTSAVDVDD